MIAKRKYLYCVHLPCWVRKIASNSFSSNSSFFPLIFPPHVLLSFTFFFFLPVFLTSATPIGTCAYANRAYLHYLVSQWKLALIPVQRAEKATYKFSKMCAFIVPAYRGLIKASHGSPRSKWTCREIEKRK